MTTPFVSVCKNNTMADDNNDKNDNCNDNGNNVNDNNVNVKNVNVQTKTFYKDLASLTRRISATINFKTAAAAGAEPKLGNALQNMASSKQLLKRKLIDAPEHLRKVSLLSNEARDYLNALQIEKMASCHTCYHKNANNARCEFHKKYLFNANADDNVVHSNDDNYAQFVISEMGIISFIELYYTYLRLNDFWRPTALMLMRDLTGYSSVCSVLRNCGYETDENVDKIEMDEVVKE
ncbi:ac34 [Lambdina fiscellaria nucleopolyhedrovirus]|uniref:Ac34 n=1 Tax=Lambdina fiscellaria nucleopolyhedrovirus TaxID=1642929 RepID=A0A0E3Z647_9ABAC|nr:ac34 [Lambdina fiscellaria nucleopolyhedrovirus]AKC91737.1 ac34 [Lambdina fiscellaria nucleopolyhedrovirus]